MCGRQTFDALPRHVFEHGNLVRSFAVDLPIFLSVERLCMTYESFLYCLLFTEKLHARSG